MMSKGVENRMQQIFRDEFPLAKRIVNYMDEESFHEKHPREYQDIALSSIQRKFLEYEGIDKEKFWNIITLLKTNGYIHEKRKERYTLSKPLRRKVN